MKQLYVAGRNDGKLRVVEHIPVDMNVRQTTCGPDYFIMRLKDDDGTWRRQIIHRSRIISREEDRYGHPDLAALRGAA